MDNLRRSRRDTKKREYEYFPLNETRFSSYSKRRVKQKVEYFVPDGILTDIISRLPAEDVIRCRRVCKRWKDSTSGQDFLELHTQRSVSMVLVENNSKFRRLGSFLLNKWWEPERKKSIVHRFDHKHFANFSHGGLIVSQKHVHPEGIQEHIVFNPMNGESIRITFSKERSKGYMYGVFYHPSLKEYCTLWGITRKVKPMEIWPKETEYRILNLGFDPQWREIRNPWRLRVRIFVVPPVLLDKYIYWLVEATDDCTIYYYRTIDKKITCHFEIMQFDIVNERFTLMSMPCRIPVFVKGYDCNLRLLNVDGLLSLVKIVGSMKQIDVSIWTLKDGEKQIWTSSCCSIGCEVYPKKANLKVGMLQPIAVVKEELVFQSDRRLFVCSLKCGTIRKVGQKRYGYSVCFLSHSLGFASLKTCTPHMYIDEHGMVDEEKKKRIVTITASLEISG